MTEKMCLPSGEKPTGEDGRNGNRTIKAVEQAQRMMLCCPYKTTHIPKLCDVRCANVVCTNDDCWACGEMLSDFDWENGTPKEFLCAIGCLTKEQQTYLMRAIDVYLKS
jgi:hypothetical protein